MNRKTAGKEAAKSNDKKKKTSLKMLVLVCWFDFSYFLTFLSECAHYSDCPNEGQNYNCINNKCKCASGYDLVGDACVGMLPNKYFNVTSKVIRFTNFAFFVNLSIKQKFLRISISY